MLTCGDTWLQSKGRGVRDITVINVLRDRERGGAGELRLSLNKM